MNVATRLVHPLRPLYRGFFTHPLLLLVALFFLAMAWEWGGFTRDYGLSAVFWHKRWWTQFVNGFGTALLLGQLCFVAYLRDIDREWLQSEKVPPDNSLAQRFMWLLVPDPPIGSRNADPERQDEALRVEAERPYWAKLRWYLLATWVPLLVLVLTPFLYSPSERFALPCGVLAALLWTPISVFLLNRIRTRIHGGAWVTSRLERRGVDENYLARIVTFLFVAILVDYLVVLFLCVFPNKDASGENLGLTLKDSPVGSWIFVLLIFLASGMVVALGVVGIGSAFLRFGKKPVAEQWRHTVAGFSFGLAFALFLLTVLASLRPDVEQFVMWNVVPPVVGVCLLIGLIVIVDNTLRFHFPKAYVPAWLTLIGLSVLANSFEDRRLHFPGLTYPTAEKDMVQPVASYPSDVGDVNITYLDCLHLWNQCDRFCTRLGERGANLSPKLNKFKPIEKDTPVVLKSKYDGLKMLRDANPGGLLHELDLADLAELNSWQAAASQADGGGKPKLVVVATVGGANRAALWTVVALTGLEGLGEELPNFPRHVRLITGASGGMVGACYYVATLNKSGQHERPVKSDGTPGDPLPPATMLKEVADDHLTPVIHRAIFREFPLLFSPLLYKGDRGVALEEAWQGNMGNALHRPFKDLAPGEREGWRPSLIVTPMLVEDGRQLLISNLFLHSMTENSGQYAEPCNDGDLTGRPLAGARKRLMVRENPGDRSRYRYSLSGLEFFQMFDDPDNKFMLATAARMNASFPYVSPAVDLPVRPRRRVVDAGYHDNYGVKSAAAWIDSHFEWLRDNTSGVILIQLRDNASDQRRLAPGDNTGSDAQKITARWGSVHGLEWVYAPPSAAAAARGSVMSFRNDEQLDALSYDFNTRIGRKEFFTTVVFSFPEETAVNWYLSPGIVKRIKAGWPGNRADEKNDPVDVRNANARALDGLKCWWKVDHSIKPDAKP